MPDGFNETPVRGKHRHNGGPVDDTAIASLPAVATAALPALIEGNIAHLSTDLTGRLRVALSDPSEGSTLDVDVTDRLERILGLVRTDDDTRGYEDARIAGLRDALLGALESVDLNVVTRDDLVARLSANLESVDLNPATRDDIVARLTASITDLRDTLTANLEAVSLNADTRDDLVTRLSAAITDLRDTLSGNLESVELNMATRDDLVTRLSAALESIDLNQPTLDALERTTPQVRGGDVSDTNPLPVNIQSNPGTLVDTGLLTTVDLAPGADTILGSAAVGTGTGHALEVTAASSVRIKVVLRTVTNGPTPTITNRRVFFVDPTGESLVYRPVDRDALTAPTAGRFEVVITNMDNLRTADVYASVTHVEL